MSWLPVACVSCHLPANVLPINWQQQHQTANHFLSSKVLQESVSSQRATFASIKADKSSQQRA